MTALPSRPDQFALWRDRQLPDITQLHPSLWVVPLAAPAYAIRFTFAYVVVGDDGAIVVDPGADADPEWDRLIAALAMIGVEVADVHGVIATHLHPDHIGMAARLADAAGCWVGVHPRERAAIGVLLDGGIRAAKDRDREWMRACGVDDAHADLMVQARWPLSVAERLRAPDLDLEDGFRLPLGGREVVVRATPGHTPGHISLVDLDNRCVILGDHVLPRISPNVSYSPGGDPDPLGTYLASLALLGEYPGYEGLPAHEYAFLDVAERAQELAAEHQARGEEVRALVAARSRSAWSVAQDLSWARPWEQMDPLSWTLALGETDAHLRHLVSGRTATVRG